MKTTFTVEDLAALYQGAWARMDSSWNGVMFTKTSDQSAEEEAVHRDLDPRIAPLIGSALDGDENYDLRAWTAKPYSFAEARAESNINEKGEP